MGHETYARFFTLQEERKGKFTIINILFHLDKKGKCITSMETGSIFGARMNLIIPRNECFYLVRQEGKDKMT